MIPIVKHLQQIALTLSKLAKFNYHAADMLWNRYLNDLSQVQSVEHFETFSREVEEVLKDVLKAIENDPENSTGEQSFGE